MNAKDRRMQRRAFLNRKHPTELVKVVRSFSRTIQVVQYEPVNVFCSLSIECYAADAADKSLAAVEWCKTQVQRDIKAFRDGDPVPQSKNPAAQANARAFEEWGKPKASRADDKPGTRGTPEVRSSPVIPATDLSLPVHAHGDPPWKGKPSPLQQKLAAAGLESDFDPNDVYRK